MEKNTTAYKRKKASLKEQQQQFKKLKSLTVGEMLHLITLGLKFKAASEEVKRTKAKLSNLTFKGKNKTLRNLHKIEKGQASHKADANKPKKSPVKKLKVQ